MSIARRAGVIRTTGVARRTTALLLRLRYDLRTRSRGAGERVALAEEVRILGFAGQPNEATLIDETGSDALLDLVPSGNVNPDLAHYNGIVPCGIKEYGVTSLHQLGIKASMSDLDQALQRSWLHVFG